MPELPEVETMCRGISPVVGATIKRVVDPNCAFRPLKIQPTIKTIHRQLHGRLITGVSRIGKRVLIETEPFALVLQPKMTGLVAIDRAPDAAHVRLILTLASNKVNELLYWDSRGLGTVALIPKDDVQRQLVIGKLGPDALAITESDFFERLASTHRPIKVALLDQKILAGVGNLYASEMLHAAHIDPRTPASKLNSNAYRRLFQQMLRILLEAIEHEGSTLSDGTYRNALSREGSYQSKHLVYDREDENCRSCGKSAIVRIVQAQRSTFFCPTCQKR